MVNGANKVKLYELREAAIGTGAQTADIAVAVSGATEGDGAATQATAYAVAGVDQAAAVVQAQASSAGTAEKSIVVGAFGLGDALTWTPGTGEILIGYAASGSAAGGASREVAAAGTHTVSWSGATAARPTLLLAAYAAAPAAPVDPAALSPATGTAIGIDDVTLAGSPHPRARTACCWSRSTTRAARLAA